MNKGYFLLIFFLISISCSDEVNTISRSKQEQLDLDKKRNSTDINLALASKCYAFLQHRGYVIPEDVRSVIYDVLRHRIGLTYEAEAENVSSEDLISKIINQVEVP